jgi:nucleoside-diphosphate-sugar epimerase
MKIIMTGAKGYIGSQLVLFFKKKKIIVKKVDCKDLKYIKINETFTHFIHLEHYIKNTKKNFENNIRNIKKVLNFCNINNLFLIFPSTASFKYSNFKRLSDDINPINLYSLSKKISEKEILKKALHKNLRYTILRIFNVYGGSKKNRWVVASLIKRFKKENILSLTNSHNIREFIHIEDLCKLFVKVVRLNIVGKYEVSSGKQITILSLAKKIKVIFNYKNKIQLIKPYKSKFNNYSKSSIKKTIKDFNWKPKINIDKGLRKLL